MQSAQGLFSINGFLLGTHVDKMPLMFLSKKKPDRLIDGVTNSLMRLPNLQAARISMGGGDVRLNTNEHHLTSWGPLPLGLMPQFTLFVVKVPVLLSANKFYTTQLLTYFFIVKSKCKMITWESLV